MQLSGDRWSPSLTVALSDKNFRGQVNIDWIDGENRILATNVYQVDSNVFTLPVPRFEDGRIARVAGVYASHDNGDFDELAGFKLDFDSRNRHTGFKWPKWFNSGKQRATDTLLFSGFDESPDHDDETVGDD